MESTTPSAASATNSRASTDRGNWKKRLVDPSAGNAVAAAWA
jgi:hypothetical protein